MRVRSAPPPRDPDRLREIAAATAGLRGGATEGEWLAETGAKALLRASGIPVPAAGTADDEASCLAVAREIGWPVALKLSAPGLLHKSESGALALGLGDEEALRQAYARLRATAVGEDASLLVEEMVPAGAEILVSARADAVVPALVIGLGGIWAEALAEVAVIPLPASPARAEQALRSLRGAPLLAGGRGGPPLAIGAAAELAAAVGELLLRERLSLLELNPVAVTADRAVALDAVARR